MSEYSAIPSTGKLKLKGVKDSRVDKKKKKKKPPPTDDPDGNNLDADPPTDNSVVLRQLADEDAQITKDARRKIGVVDGKDVLPGSGLGDGDEDVDVREHLKTEAERRYDEQRRKRVSFLLR